MRIGQIIGTVTLSQQLETVSGGCFKLAVPLSLEDLGRAAAPDREEIVVYDQYGAGDGARIALSEGAEAAQPFRPEEKPIDAYNAAILDHLDVDPSVMPPRPD